MPSNVISTELKLMIGNCFVARKNCRRKSSSKTHYRKIAEEEEAARPIKAWQKNIAEGSSCFSQLPPVLQQNVLCSRTSRHRQTGRPSELIYKMMYDFFLVKLCFVGFVWPLCQICIGMVHVICFSVVL